MSQITPVRRTFAALDDVRGLTGILLATPLGVVAAEPGVDYAAAAHAHAIADVHLLSEELLRLNGAATHADVTGLLKGTGEAVVSATAGVDYLAPTGDGSGLTFDGHKIAFAAAAPTSGTWAAGDVVYNTAPTAGGKVGWACTVAGTPGTWKAFGAIDP